jgi:hypothetical protein
MTNINAGNRVGMSHEVRERVDTLEMLIIHRLHIVTKLNYHDQELSELHQSLAYNLLNPITALKSRVDFSYLKRYSGDFADLHGDI